MLTVEQAAAMLRVGRSTAYLAIQRGRWPTSVVRVGTAIRIPTAEVLRLLAVHIDGHEAVPDEGQGDEPWATS